MMDNCVGHGVRTHGGYRLAAVPIIVSVVGVVICFKAWSTPRRANGSSSLAVSPSRSATADVAFQPHNSQPVEIPLALLCDYYEHGLEHAPPRDPTGVMQQRERWYHAPSDPFEEIAVNTRPTPQDKHLAEALEDWRGIWLAGASAESANFQQLAQASSMDSVSLMHIAKAMDWLCGDEISAQFWRAALAKATVEFANSSPGDRAGTPLLRELDQSKALWRLKDYGALELRFALSRKLNLPLSVESRRAGYLLCDALYYQDRFGEAADTVLAVQRENIQAGDLGALEKSDLDEMQYMQGYLLYSAGRIEEAIPFLHHVKAGGEHDHTASRVLFLALLKTSRFAEARNYLREMTVRLKLSTEAAENFQAELEQAAQAQEWQKQIASID